MCMNPNRAALWDSWYPGGANLSRKYGHGLQSQIPYSGGTLWLAAVSNHCIASNVCGWICSWPWPNTTGCGRPNSNQRTSANQAQFFFEIGWRRLAAAVQPNTIQPPSAHLPPKLRRPRNLCPGTLGQVTCPGDNLLGLKVTITSGVVQNNGSSLNQFKPDQHKLLLAFSKQAQSLPLFQLRVVTTLCQGAAAHTRHPPGGQLLFPVPVDPSTFP